MMGLQSFMSPMNWQSRKRLEYLEGQGIAAEVIFPNTIPPFFPSGVITASAPRSREEYEARWAGVQAHNRWLVDYCNDVPGRRAGLAQIFLNDIDAAVAEVRWAKENGLKGVLIPGDHTRQLVNLYYTALDSLWAICAELDMPVCKHTNGVGEPSTSEAPTGPAIGNHELKFFSRRALAHMILSGVFERHPP